MVYNKHILTPQYSAEIVSQGYSELLITTERIDVGIEVHNDGRIEFGYNARTSPQTAALILENQQFFLELCKFAVRNNLCSGKTLHHKNEFAHTQIAYKQMRALKQDRFIIIIEPSMRVKEMVHQINSKEDDGFVQ